MNNPKLINQNSFDTLVMSSRRLSRVDTSINCSQQSILNAMERFVKSVENMDSTVLVPSKLRDMDISKITSCNVNARRKTSQCKAPTILHNTDLYAFYLMLHEIKKELMWGPSSSTGMCAIGSSGFSQSNGSINNICNSSFNNTNTSNLFNNFGSNYNLGNSKFNKESLAGLSLSQYNNSLINSQNQMNNSCFSSISCSTNASSNASSSSNASTNSSTNGFSTTYTNNNLNSTQKYLTKELREKHHSRQPSDDSSVSSSISSTLDIETSDSLSEVDSVLADRESSNSQTSDEHTLHLAAAFKHHLQGLHQILDTLTNTADFFCARYQEEVDGLSEN